MDAEKDTLRKRLEAIINDKIRYAGERCLEEMCEDEPYRLHPLGQLDDIDGITPQSLTEAIISGWLTHAFDLYVVGDTTLEEVKASNRSLQIERRYAYPTYSLPSVKRTSRKSVPSSKDGCQSRQAQYGAEINTSYGDDDYPAALMYNGILAAIRILSYFLMCVKKQACLLCFRAS